MEVVSTVRFGDLDELSEAMEGFSVPKSLDDEGTKLAS